MAIEIEEGAKAAAVRQALLRFKRRLEVIGNSSETDKAWALGEALDEILEACSQESTQAGQQ